MENINLLLQSGTLQIEDEKTNPTYIIK